MSDPGCSDGMHKSSFSSSRPADSFPVWQQLSVFFVGSCDSSCYDSFVVFANAFASLATLNMVVAVVVVVVSIVVVVVGEVVTVFLLLFSAALTPAPVVVALSQGFELEGPAGLERLLPATIVVVAKENVVVPFRVLVALTCRELSCIGCRLVEVESFFRAAPGFVAKLLAAFGDGGVSSG